MYLIRRAKVDDCATLLKLAKMVHFINLPPDKDIITQKIVHSRNSFLKIADEDAKPEPEPMPRTLAGIGVEPSRLRGLGSSSVHTELFMFVLEDTESGNVLGTSQTLAHMGGPGNPNYSLRLEKREFFSESLQTGTTQTVAVLHEDESGPSEIGGLILQPSYRGHPRKLGAFLSIVRFHFMGLHRGRFAERVLAEMMAPITSDSHNLLWDFLGRRFIPLSYEEADRFCQYSREFIASMLPRDPLYLSLLPPAARAVIGEVGPETQPARRMLEKLGFAFHGFVDPFDGGPHLTAATDEIPLVRDTRWTELGEAVEESVCDRVGIVSVLKANGEYFAAQEPFTLDARGRVCLPEEAMVALRSHAGTTVGVTPTDGLGPVDQAMARVNGALRGGERGESGGRSAPKKTRKKPAKKSDRKPTPKPSKKPGGGADG